MSVVIKYDPFRELRNLQDEMTRLFTGVRPASSDREEMTHGAWAPSVDIYEDKDRLILEAELPGMNREDFEISVENNIITLRGERKFEKKTEGDNYHRVERSYGSFLRSFTRSDGYRGWCDRGFRQWRAACQPAEAGGRQRLARSRSPAPSRNQGHRGGRARQPRPDPPSLIATPGYRACLAEDLGVAASLR